MPRTIKAFIARFPGLSLTLQQCDPGQCRQAIAPGDTDVGIVTLSQKAADTVVTKPAYRVPRCVVVPTGHPLLREQPLEPPLGRLPSQTSSNGDEKRRPRGAGRS